MSLAVKSIAAWRRDHNQHRQHRALTINPRRVRGQEASDADEFYINHPSTMPCPHGRSDRIVARAGRSVQVIFAASVIGPGRVEAVQASSC